MIKGIMSGNGINVQGGTVSYPYVPMNSSNPIQGMLRLNGQDMQVFDGTTWINLAASYTTVELNSEILSVIQWARDERNKQLARSTLVRNNPALGKALEAIERAEANFDMIAKFVEHDSDRSDAGMVQASP